MTITELAAELDPHDPGATANAMHGYLGHLTHKERLGELSVADEADLRAAFGQAR